ncbi:MAG: hypothetical protein R3E86_02570 [Pseudomonadales bacterium]
MAHFDPSQDPVEADRKADLRAILVVFVTIVVGAVYFASGWHF